MRRAAFTLIELLVVIAIIAILAVVVVLTLNPAQLLAQSRDANRASDLATLQSAINLYQTDLSGSSGYSLGTASTDYLSIPDTSSTCGNSGMPTSSYAYHCSSASNYRMASSSGWLPLNFNLISSGSPFGSVPIDPTNQTSSGLFYSYNSNGSQYQLIAAMESKKYRASISSPLGSGVDVQGSIANSGPVGWWPLTEGGSATTTADASGNGSTGYWSGTQTAGSYYTTSAKVGSYAGLFNGIDDYVNVSSPSAPLLLTGPITMSAWIYPTSSVNYNNIIWEGNGGTRNYAVYTQAANTSQIYVALGGTNIGAITISTPWAVNAWNFVAVTADGSTVRIYLNGALVATTASTLLPTAGANQFVIGNNGYYFPGMINDVRVYARALSGPEVLAIYNSEK